MRQSAEIRQQEILEYLAQHQGQKIRQREIAEQIQVSQQIVSRRLRELMDKSLVRYVRSLGYQVYQGGA
jgi:Mn-dependent DtxR family transcriptional regulator